LNTAISIIIDIDYCHFDITLIISLPLLLFASCIDIIFAAIHAQLICRHMIIIDAITPPLTLDFAIIAAAISVRHYAFAARPDFCSL